TGEQQREWYKQANACYGSVEGLEGLSWYDGARARGILKNLGMSNEAATQLACRWVAESTDWHDWTDTGALEWMTQWLSRRKSRATDARVALFRHFTQQWIDGAEGSAAPTHAIWEALRSDLESDLPADQRSEWARKIRGVLESGREMSVEDVDRVAAALKSLGDEQAPQAVLAWFERTGPDIYRQAPVGRLVSLARRTAKADPDAPKKLMQQFGRGWQAAHQSESLPADTCRTIAASWQRMGNSRRAQQWAMRAYVAAFGAAEPPAEQQRQRLASLLETVGLGGGVSEMDCETLFRRMRAAPPTERAAAWPVCADQLHPDAVNSLGQQALQQLDTLLAAQPADPAWHAQMLGDLLARSEDEYYTSPQLRRRLRRVQLAQAASQATGRQRQVLTDALKALQGAPERATAACQAALAQVGADSPAAPALRRQLLDLLLSADTVDVSAAEKQLAALDADASADDAELFNARCQLLLHRIAASDAGNPPAIWREGLGSLQAHRPCLSASTLMELDELVEQLPASSKLDAPEMLADLMLLAPDLATLGRLQMRRSELFAESEDVSDAVAASRLVAIVAWASPSGPRPAAKRCLSLMRSAGQSAVERAAFERTLVVGPADGAPAGPVVDQPLRRAARRAQRRLPDSVGPRRRAMVAMLAGDSRQAARQMHAAITALPVSKQPQAQEELAVLLALADGHCGDCDRFLAQLCSGEAAPADADPLLAVLAEADAQVTGDQELSEDVRYGRLSRAARAELGADLLAEMQARRLTWSEEAMADGDQTWATALWAAALNAAPSDTAAELADEVVQVTRRHGIAGNSPALLDELVPVVRRTATCRHLLGKLARGLYTQADYAGCLELLDRADRAGDQPIRDLDVGSMRLMSHIRLGQFDKARKLAEQMQSWDGTDKQQAETLFLVGWLHMRQGGRDEAVDAWKEVVDSYPATPSAEKAGKLLRRIQGS
ncbi:MAG: hypothetical protein ACOC93_04200, partial [Planctomycetota bacterium]